MKLVTPADVHRLPPGPRLRLTAEVLITYVRVRARMRHDDAERAVAQLRDPARVRALDLTEREQLIVALRLAHAAGRVLRLLPTDSRCLFRSLTLMCMLDRRGLEQKLVIAVRPRPFSAHAWVEVDGQPVLPGAEPGYERLLEL